MESPEAERRILPSLSPEQLDYLIDQAECVRDKTVTSLFADSGLRLSELASIDEANIDRQHRLIKVICEGTEKGWLHLVKGLRSCSADGYRSTLIVVSRGIQKHEA